MRRSIVALVIAALGTGLAPVAHAGDRWPSWPTEVDRIAAPLRTTDERIAGERERASALSRLEVFATPVIEDEVLRALEDPASAVRREALRLCYLRRITRCISEASAIWGKGIEPTLRIAALRVLALDLDASRLAILLGALRAPGDELRAQAAQILGWAMAAPGSRDEVRSALLAKLSDSAALVRRRAVESLGLLGPGPGTLAMARLLDDPEPTVRSAAAVALARARDERAAPALIRAVDGQNEAVVARAILMALALLPAPDVGPALLRKLDDPPTGLSAFQVAEALGGRPNPEPEIVEGLIDRLREPELRKPALRALLLMGAPTKDSLEAALARGLDPSLQLELQRLLAALQPLASAPDRPVRHTPLAADIDSWRDALRVGPMKQRLEAAARLGELAPPWVDAAIGRRLERPGPLEAVAPWLLVMATAQRPLDVGGGRWLPWARLEGWGQDHTKAASDRCLAVLALGSSSARAHRRRIHEALVRLAADPEPEVRMCVAMAGRGPSPGIAELLLVDVDPRVRATAALAVRAHAGASKSGRARAEMLARVDPSARVRTAASASVPRRDPAAVRWFGVEPAPMPWAQSTPWLELRVAGRSLWLPAVGTGEVRWAVVPPLGDDVELVEPESRI